MGTRSEMVSAIVSLSREAVDLKRKLVKMGAEDARAIADEAREFIAAEQEEVQGAIDGLLDFGDEL